MTGTTPSKYKKDNSI